MRTTQQGDRVRVHFVKKAANGAMTSSHGQEPIELTVGTEHRRLRGLGLALVGLGEGERVEVVVPPQQAYGVPDPERVRRLARWRFPIGEAIASGKWVRVAGRSGRRHLVRVVEVNDKMVVVDTNHPLAGQSMSLEVQIVSIQAAPA